MTRTTRTMLAAGLLAGAAAVALALPVATAGQHGAAVGFGPQDGALAAAITRTTRSTDWKLVEKVPLRFPTFHPEGVAVVGDRVFLSSVEVTERTVKYPTPQGGYDRTPGKGVGHVFVLDRAGNLQRDIVLGEGDMYHPGGLDFDGTSVWTAVAQYRPNSSAIIYSIDARSLQVRERFRVNDHIGGIVRDRVTGHLVGNNWGSRRFYDWTAQGREVDRWANPSHFIDGQDCKYVDSRKQVCGGIAELPQTPAAGGTTAKYELGGFGLSSLRDGRLLHEVPVQRWSTAGHVITRNPFQLSVSGDTLSLLVAPDDGNEGNGTELLRYQATVPAS